MDADTVLYAICQFGLRMNPADLSPNEHRRQLELVETMLQDHGRREIVEAVRYGMQDVWPFSEGRPFDAKDVRNNLLKAKAVAAQKRRAGDIPSRIVHTPEEPRGA